MSKIIYRIDIDGGRKFYYGSSKRGLEYRKGVHLYFLEKNKHPNHHMQNLFNKGCSFEFISIEQVNNRDLLEVEQQYLDIFTTHPDCCNIATKAGGGLIGEITPERIQKQINTKQSNNRFGGANTNSWEAARRTNIGAKRSQQSKQKMSEAAKQRYQKDPNHLANAQTKGRINRWETQCKPFYLIKDSKRYGPFKRQKDAYMETSLSSVSVSKLYLGKKNSIKGFVLEFIE